MCLSSAISAEVNICMENGSEEIWEGAAKAGCSLRGSQKLGMVTQLLEEAVASPRVQSHCAWARQVGKIWWPCPGHWATSSDEKVLRSGQDIKSVGLGLDQ